MKMGKRVLAAMVLLALPFLSMPQCVTPLETVTFDSTFTGSGNAYHTFTFPRFDASFGTLVEVRIQAEITLRYRFQLENRENININNYRVRVVRDDEISSASLQTPITNTHQTTYGPYALAAYDGTPGSGSDYTSVGPMYVMNRSMVEETVYNTADFLGPGNVSFDYSAMTYSIVFGSVNYNFNGTAEDTVRMVVTYRYCSTWFLPADLTSFTASRNNNETIDIRWTAVNEKQDRGYTIEKSSDGKNFQPVATQHSAKGSYQHTYAPAANETGKLIFRLKQTEADGTIKYSALRIVELRKKQLSSLKLYPNPASGTFNILFSNTTRGDWDVVLVTTEGRILKQCSFNRALTGKMDLQGVARGTYFVKAVNRKNQQQLVQTLIVR